MEVIIKNRLLTNSIYCNIITKGTSVGFGSGSILSSFLFVSYIIDGCKNVKS